jgi:hypothetical protein
LHGEDLTGDGDRDGAGADLGEIDRDGLGVAENGEQEQ